MGRKAKPLKEQVEKLRKRGMIIRDPEKARRILLEIGWYRMSFYWFPFETCYPDRFSDHHQFRDGTTFEDALLLYAFDFNMRHTLMMPIERIETAFRTYIIHTVSTRYPDSPYWMADEHVVTATHARQFDRQIYQPMKRQIPEIALHHKRFPHDKFAPAWRTLEFMTFGAMCTLFESLKSDALKHDVARHFGVHNPDIFLNYLSVVRSLRNLCAHGNILYSWRPEEIMQGPAMGGKCRPPRNLNGAISVVEHFLGIISERLLQEFRTQTEKHLAAFSKSRGSCYVLRKIAGFNL